MPDPRMTPGGATAAAAGTGGGTGGGAPDGPLCLDPWDLAPLLHAPAGEPAPAPEEAPAPPAAGLADRVPDPWESVPAPPPEAAEAGLPADPVGILRGTGQGDVLVISTNSTYLGLGGEDTFLISTAVLPDTRSVIEDGGINRVQLTDGLAIAASRVRAGAIELTLENGAVLQLLTASAYSFETGGNVTTGQTGTVRDFDTFVDEVLGATGPDGMRMGGPVTIGEDPGLLG